MDVWPLRLFHWSIRCLGHKVFPSKGAFLIHDGACKTIPRLGQFNDPHVGEDDLVANNSWGPMSR